ncbi:hypothetical protein AB0C40_35825, partial [Streptomyces brevispora]
RWHKPYNPCSGFGVKARHACATHNYERGRSLWEVQKMLGHDQPTTTVSHLATAHADPKVAGLAASGRAVQRLAMDNALPASCATDDRAGLNRYDASPPAARSLRILFGPDRRRRHHPRSRHPLPARQIDIHQRAVEQRIQTLPEEIADELLR